MSDPVPTPAASIVYSFLGERARPPTITRVMTMALENPDLLSLAAGFTDNSTLPVAAVQAVVDQLARSPGEPEYLQYGSNVGRPGLREVLAARLCALEPILDPAAVRDGFLITNGSQQALYLTMQVLCEPGDIVLVDRPSYFVFLEMLTGLGIEARSLPTDEDGALDAPALGRLLKNLKSAGQASRVKAVYFVSYFSNPTGLSLGAGDKARIATELAAAGLIVPVVEDAAYRELYYTTPHDAPSVLSMPAWQPFPKLYLSTLTKPFASGLKIGFGTCSNAGWLAKMLHIKGHQDFGSANFNQAVMEQIVKNGGLDAQLQRIRPAYEHKMRALHQALVEAGLPALGWHWTQPAGGLYLWLSAPAELDTGLESAFFRACVTEGVLYVPGDLCFGDEAPRHLVRLSFGVLRERDLVEAARRFGRVAQRVSETAD